MRHSYPNTHRHISTVAILEFDAAPGIPALEPLCSCNPTVVYSYEDGEYVVSHNPTHEDFRSLPHELTGQEHPTSWYWRYKTLKESGEDWLA